MIKTIKRRSDPDWDVLMKRSGGKLGSDAEFRRMLDNIHKQCYIEAGDTSQGGMVIRAVRDRFGIPVAAEVEYRVYDADNEKIIAVGKDYIAMADVTFWEPNDSCATIDEYDDYDWEEYYLSNGYVWSDERECYYNAETGDEAVW